MEAIRADQANQIRARRDAKARPHLEQYAPVWLLDEEFDFHNEAVRFNVVFRHPRYSWVSRRYRYDSYNDVLYYMGQTLVREDDALEIEATEPYIQAEILNTIDAYGG